MNSMPTIITIRPKAPLKKRRLPNYYNEEEEEEKQALTSRPSEIKLPSLSPNTSVKTLHRPFPITKVSIIPTVEQQKFMIASNSNTQFKPHKIYSKFTNHKITRVKVAQNVFLRKTPSPGLSNYSQICLTEISGIQKKIHLRPLLNSSIYKPIDFKDNSFS